jgi:hypothetical protein
MLVWAQVSMVGGGGGIPRIPQEGAVQAQKSHVNAILSYRRHRHRHRHRQSTHSTDTGIIKQPTNEDGGDRDSSTTEAWKPELSFQLRIPGALERLQ